MRICRRTFPDGNRPNESSGYSLIAMLGPKIFAGNTMYCAAVRNLLGRLSILAHFLGPRCPAKAAAILCLKTK